MSDRDKFLKSFKLISQEFREDICVYYATGDGTGWGYTYLELDRVSDSLSQFFLKNFQGQWKYVGVSISDYSFLPCVILGIWKSGGSFAGIGTQYSKRSTLKYLDFLGIRYLVSDTSEGYGEVVVEFCIRHQKLFILCRNERAESDGDFCYGIMTSGSTGEPKIIQVPWSCILQNVKELSELFQVKQSDCIFQASPYTFDPFFVEFLLTLLSGCSFLIVSNSLKLSSSNLLKTLFTNSETIFKLPPDSDSQNHFDIQLKKVRIPNISFLQMTPSIFKKWRDDEIKNFILSDQTKLRLLILGGEKFPKEILTLRHSNNSTRIFNIYGITEISCWAFLNDITTLSVDEEVSLGRPLTDIEYTISESGEFFIGSKTRTCLVNSEKKAATQRDTGDVVRKENEQIYYVGRSNQLVKKYGIKINLNKIEEAFLNANKSIKACCCVYNEENRKLGLFYVPEFKESNSFISFEDFCKKGYKVPRRDINDIEVPDYLVELTELPLNSHGKRDREELSKRLGKVSKPELDLKNDFARIWCEVLGLEKMQPVGFLEAGGSSVSALEMMNKLEDLGCRVPQDFIKQLLAGEDFESCLRCLTDFETPRKKIKLNDEDSTGIRFSMRWKFDLEKCVDASPTVFTYQGKERVVVGSHSSKLSCLDFDSGEEIWSVRLGDRIESGFKASKDGTRGFVGCYDRYIYCLAVFDGGILWRFQTGDVVKSTPCLSSDGKVVFVPSYDKHLYCLSTEDGGLLERVKLSGGGVYGTGLVCEEVNALYVGTLDGTCVALDQETKKIRWRRVLGSPVFASPCFLPEKSGIVFCEVLGVLHCFHAVDGTNIWSYKANGNIYSSPIVQKSNLIFGCHDHHLYCLRYDVTPEPKWRQQLDSAIFAKPSYVPENSICAATTKGIIYLCDLNSGTIKTRFKLPGEVFSSAVNRYNRVILGCRDNNAYALNVS